MQLTYPYTIVPGAKVWGEVYEKSEALALAMGGNSTLEKWRNRSTNSGHDIGKYFFDALFSKIAEGVVAWELNRRELPYVCDYTKHDVANKSWAPDLVAERHAGLGVKLDRDSWPGAPKDRVSWVFNRGVRVPEGFGKDTEYRKHPLVGCHLSSEERTVTIMTLCRPTVFDYALGACRNANNNKLALQWHMIRPEDEITNLGELRQ